MKITSEYSILQKSVGINSDAATWIEEADGDYELTSAPGNWQDLIAEADNNTHGCKPGQTEIGEESDWEWWRLCETNADGFLTGVEWLVARYVG